MCWQLAGDVLVLLADLSCRGYLTLLTHTHTCTRMRARAHTQCAQTCECRQMCPASPRKKRRTEKGNAATAADDEGGEAKTLYDMLQVSKTASQAEIKKVSLSLCACCGTPLRQARSNAYGMMSRPTTPWRERCIQTSGRMTPRQRKNSSSCRFVCLCVENTCVARYVM